MMTLRKPALLGLGILAILLIGCGGGPEKQIVGKWQVKSIAMGGQTLPMPPGQSIVEFKADKTVVGAGMGQGVEIKYEFTDAKHIKLSGTGMVEGQDLSMFGAGEAKVEIDGDKMTMGDDEGIATVELERVK